MSGSEGNSSCDGSWSLLISHIWSEDSNMQISFKKAGFTLLDTAFLWGASGVSAVNWTKSPNLRREWTCDWQHEREKDSWGASHAVSGGRVTCLGFLQVWEEVQHGGPGDGMAVGARFKPEPWTRVRNLALNLQTNVKLQRKSKPDDSKYSLINLGWNLSRVCYDSEYLIFTDFEQKCTLFEDIHNTGIKFYHLLQKGSVRCHSWAPDIIYIFLCVCCGYWFVYWSDQCLGYVLCKYI